MKIVDIQPFKYQLVENETSHGKTRVRGVFQRADEKNANGRVYPRKLWEKILSSNDLKETIERRRMVGEVDHPMESEVKLSKAAVVITGLAMNENNEVIGELEILPTEYGKHVSALFNSGVEVGISSRGEGSTYEKEGVEYISEDDYRLLAFDIVASPSTRGAYPALLRESKTPENSNDKRIEEIQMSANQNLTSLRENIRSVVGTDLSKTTKDQRSRLVTEAERLVGDLSKVTAEDPSFRILGESLASDLLHFVKQAESEQSSPPVLENQMAAAAEIIEAMASEVKAREGKVLRLASKRIAEATRKQAATIAQLREKNSRLVRENSRLRKTLETAEVVGEEITNQFIALSKNRKSVKESKPVRKVAKRTIVEARKKTTSSKILEKLAPKKVRIKESKPQSRTRPEENDQVNIFESFQQNSNGSFRL